MEIVQNLDTIAKFFGNFVFPMGLSIYLIVQISKQLTTQNMTLLWTVLTLERILDHLGLPENGRSSEIVAPNIQEIKKKLGG